MNPRYDYYHADDDECFIFLGQYQDYDLYYYTYQFGQQNPYLCAVNDEEDYCWPLNSIPTEFIDIIEAAKRAYQIFLPLQNYVPAF